MNTNLAVLASYPVQKRANYDCTSVVVGDSGLGDNTLSV